MYISFSELFLPSTVEQLSLQGLAKLLSMHRLSRSTRWSVLFYCYVLLVNRVDCGSEDAESRRKSQDQDFGSLPEQEEWVVRIEGGSQVASLLALKSGYIHLGPVLGFEDTYLWRATNGLRYKKRNMPQSRNSLEDHRKIVWAEQQKPVRREKRGYIEDIGEIENLEYYDQAEFSKFRTKEPRAFNDELWDQEWYLQEGKEAAGTENYSDEKTKPRRLDLNVLPVYRLGITGRGVRVAVLDDGLEYTHEDLRANYDREISYDVTERDDDPIPRYEEPANGHGTRCAGEIAMEADNGKCGVGVAFEARIGGVKMLDGIVNDRVEAESLGYRHDLVDIYTASWGPPDDGRSLETPGKLASEALERGILQGRGGRGSIYVWASGNGGSKADDCGCDGYVNSIYTLAIGSASQTGTFPWYGEMCPATMATTYSSGANEDKMIATTDLKNTCTTSHTGTSASAPLAAGILALMLQVNKNLTWRDVQHLVVYTSEHSPLRGNPGWFKNAVGFWFNPRFGFGLMDAYALVTASSNWTFVPAKIICQVSSLPPSSAEVSYGRPRRVLFDASGCSGALNEIHYLEHVQVETSVEYTLRGALKMHLTSPSGTIVQILGTRKNDNSTEGFVKWKFMSVATWGENPRGIWYLDVIDEIGPKANKGLVGACKLIMHGTKERPHYLGKSLRDYEIASNEDDKITNSILDERNTLGRRIRNQTTSQTSSTKDWLVRFLLS